MRKDPSGNPLPERLHWKHGRYWYVYRNKWEALSASYSAAISAWAIRANPQSGMAGLVDRAMLAIRKKGGLADSTLTQYQQAADVIKSDCCEEAALP